MPSAFFCLSAFAATTAQLKVDSAKAPEAAMTGGELLTTFLSNDSLLWGCMAMALIALVSVGRVASRRRKAGKTNRIQREQSEAVHDFLAMVRSEHSISQQGLWYYDFETGAQQFSDEFGRILAQEEAVTLSTREIEARLSLAGIDLVRLARKHFEETDPYEVCFGIGRPRVEARPMVLKACNMRDADGKVRRLVAVLNQESGKEAAPDI